MPVFTWVPHEDTDVYTVDGHLVGQVAEAWPTEYAGSRTLARMVGKVGTGYLRLVGFGKSDLYVPLDALADFSHERLRLKITRGQLARQGWDQRPDDLPAMREG